MTDAKKLEALQAEWTRKMWEFAGMPQDPDDDWSARYYEGTASLCRCEEPGWVRVGIIDRAQRRSLWARVTDDEVWLCAGREGDDSIVVFTRDNPAYAPMRSIVMRMLAVAEDGNMEDRLGARSVGRLSVADAIRADVVGAREAADRQARELARLRVGIEEIAKSTGVPRDANEDLLGWLERAMVKHDTGDGHDPS